MSRRFQFSLRWLFVAMLAVACFFGGIRFERERQRCEDEAATLATSRQQLASAYSELALKQQQLAATEREAIAAAGIAQALLDKKLAELVILEHEVADLVSQASRSGAQE
jgi:hypothetical protein